MNRSFVAMLIAGLSLSVGGIVRAEDAKEEKISLDKAPAKVQEVVKKAVGTGTLGDVVKESADGKTIYEVEFKVDKVHHSMDVTEAGEVTEEETEIEVAKLPAAVTDTIKKIFKEAKIEDAFTVKAGNASFFEVGIETGDVDQEIAIDANGTLRSVTVVKEEHGKAEKDEPKKEEGHK